jgi:hypothetical protein
MRKTIAIVSVIAAGIVAVPATAAFAAVKNGTVISTSTTVKTVTSAKCYHSHEVTVTPYHWSATTGWTKYAAPKRTVTDSTTCH